ncbi:MAG: iron ABC transporter substrate-binding protein [Chloroflexota bacterium]|nr:iron ABC transporter substrate-binding protein [Chloroflexota bacterium]
MDRRECGLLVPVALIALLLAACSAGPTPGVTTGPSTGPSTSPTLPSASSPSVQPPSSELTVYSGRSEELVAPLLEQFETDTGVTVNARYGDTAELAALILEEADAGRIQADVFFAQDAGALGAVADAGLFATLDDAVLERVDTRFRDDEGRWTGVSGRARVLAYSTESLAQSDLPASITELTDPAWAGRIGWAPTNASLQAFVTAFRQLEGEDAARAWLEGIVANDPVVYESNTTAVEGVAAGEVDLAMVNHYYLMRLLTENGPEYPVANHFLPGGDLGSLVNVAGAGIMASSQNADVAAQFVDYLVSEDAQTYFSEETYEYPLVEGIAADERLPGLDEIESPDIDLNDLADLQGTVELMRDAGALD